MNWAVFGLTVSGILLVVWLAVLIKSRRSIMSVYVSFAFLVLAGTNSAAPIRGFVDPDYVGYGFGLLRTGKGLPVTFMAGGVFLISAVCAFIAARNRTGPAMWLVAATCVALTVIQGWPWLDGVLTDPSSNTIQFGEYLTIPGAVGSALIAALLVLPFLLGAFWAGRRAQARPAGGQRV
jgi:hypothetical protein